MQRQQERGKIKAGLNGWRILFSFTTGLPSSVSAVGCAFIMAVSAYYTSKTKDEIKSF